MYPAIMMLHANLQATIISKTLPHLGNPGDKVQIRGNGERPERYKVVAVFLKQGGKRKDMVGFIRTQKEITKDPGTFKSVT